MVVYFAWPCLARATDFTMDGLISAVGVGGREGRGGGCPLLLRGGAEDRLCVAPTNPASFLLYTIR